MILDDVMINKKIVVVEDHDTMTDEVFDEIRGVEVQENNMV